jgi:hypothetical protein
MLNANRILAAVLTLPLLWMTALSVSAKDKDIKMVGEFSSPKPGDSLPQDWKPLTFRDIEKRTEYALVEDGGTTVLRARADASASALIREVRINAREYPIIQWRWKVANVLNKGDVHRKRGDDYPARLYITFELELSKLNFFERLLYEAIKLIYGRYPPSKAINYIWAKSVSKGTMVPNAYTEKAMMFVVQSGEEKVNQWVEEQRNVYEDYKQAFGAEPPLISGVAVMTDTDNTGESATAYYGDIFFKPEK